jgi:hypothetical protein
MLKIELIRRDKMPVSFRIFELARGNFYFLMMRRLKPQVRSASQYHPPPCAYKNKPFGRAKPAIFKCSRMASKQPTLFLTEI